MKNLFLFILLLVFQLGVKAQNTFQYVYDVDSYANGGRKAIELPNKQILVNLYLNNVPEVSKGHLAKLDANGDILWSKIYETSNKAIDAFSFEQVQDNEFVLSGAISTDIGQDDDHFLMKVDGDGHVIWAKSYLAATSDDYTTLGVLNDQSFLIVTDIFEQPYRSLSFIKIDSSGNVIYSKKISAPANHQLDPLKVIPTADGAAAVVGTLLNNNNEKFIFLIKVDVLGNVEWSKIYRGDGDTYNGMGVQISDGGFVITGTSMVENDQQVLSPQPLLLKTDASGNIQWSKIFSKSSGYGHGHQLVEDGDGGFVMTGNYTIESEGNCFVILKTNDDGQIQWSKYYKGFSDGDPLKMTGSIQKTLDDGFLACGRTFSSDNGEDMYLLKTNSLGEVACGGNDFILVDSVYNPTEQIINLSVENSTFTPVDLPIQVGTRNFAKSSCLLDIDEASSNVSFSVYPNPSTGIFNIDGAAEFDKIVVLDMFGRTMFTNVGPSARTVDMSVYPSGIYFMRIYGGNKVVAYEKIIV